MSETPDFHYEIDQNAELPPLDAIISHLREAIHAGQAAEAVRVLEQAATWMRQDYDSIESGDPALDELRADIELIEAMLGELKYMVGQGGEQEQEALRNMDQLVNYKFNQNQQGESWTE